MKWRYTIRLRLAGIWPLVLVLSLSVCMGAIAQQNPPPLARAHAHNDYLHEHPLLDALSYGFCSVEADIHLVAGDLLVAHDAADVQPGKTLQALYLDPLRARIQENNGLVYTGGPPFTLLIDIKTAAETTYMALHQVLTGYGDILTTYGREGVIRQGPVTVVVSGNRPRSLMAGQAMRYAGYDGRLEDLGTNPGFIPLVSDNWKNLFTWRGQGAIPQADSQKLRQIIALAHASGQRVRFWATPDDPGPARDAVWQALWEAGADLINTDHLADLQRFILQRTGQKTLQSPDPGGRP